MNPYRSHAQLILSLQETFVHVLTGECRRDEITLGQLIAQRHSA